MLAPLLFNIFFAAVINVTSTRFKADEGIMDALVHLRKKRGAGGSNCRKVSPGDAALGHALRWRCRSRLEITLAAEEDDGGDHGRVRGVWPHSVSEVKTEIMCLCGAKWMPESTATFSVEAAGQVYNQTNEFVYLGGNVSHNANLSTGAYATHGAASGSTPSNCTTDRALPSSSKPGC